MIDLRLAVPAAAAWLALVIGLQAPSGLVPIAVGAWTAAAVALVLAVWLRRSVIVLTAVVLGAVALVATSAAVHEPGRHPTVLAQAARSHHVIAATIVTTATAMPGDKPFGATLVSADGRSLEVPILVFDALRQRRIGIGTTLELSGSVQATEPADERSYLFFTTDTPRVTSAPAWWLAWPDGLRQGFARTSLSLPGDGGRLLPGLSIGDTAAVTPELDAAMKTSALSHLTAVSGANCAVVIGLVLAAARALGVRRGVRIAAALAVLVGFVLLVTPEPSVLRAAVMAALVLGALASGRPTQGIPILSAAVLALLVQDPWLAASYGFALSVLATCGLLVLARPLAAWLSRWVPLGVATAVAIPLAAQLACQPVLILLTPTLPPYGVVANTLAEPAAPIATILGLLACLVVPLAPPLGHLLAQLAWLPSAWIAAVARFFAGLPGARLPWIEGLAGCLVLAAITVLALAAVLAPARVAFRRWVLISASALLVGVVAIIGGVQVAGTLGRPANWQIADCDIGQGDAMLVRSAGKVALVDTGRHPALLNACLSTLGITRVDLLVLSHFDIDHVGGTSAVFGRADQALVGPSDRPEADALARDLAASGVPVQQVSQGASGVLGDLRWRVVWPLAKLGDVPPGNPASVTVLFDGVGTCADGCLSSLFTGDLGEDAQNRMLRANPWLGQVDVIEVSHHGSADQSAALYQRVDASIGLIGVGLGNSYGHPTSRLLDILASVGTVAARTDLDGLVLVAPGEKPGSFVVWKQKSGVGRGG